jgi:hypothetical protein
VVSGWQIPSLDFRQDCERPGWGRRWSKGVLPQKRGESFHPKGAKKAAEDAKKGQSSFEARVDRGRGRPRHTGKPCQSV